MARMITIKEAVSDASLEIGITQRPVNTVVGSLDSDIVQMASLMMAVADEVLLEMPWRESLGDGYWLIGPDGTKKVRYSSDDDRVMFDGRLMTDGLKYRFLAAKGLEFGEQLRDYTARLNKLASRVNNRVLDLNADPSVQQ